MCQISVCNLHDSELNKMLFLLMGSLGSTKHSDGWGIATQSGEFYKCANPMYFTIGAGGSITKTVKKNKNTLLGHIRDASPQIPVDVANAHPFNSDGIVFVHNGRLEPKEPKNFVTEETVPDMKEGKPVLDKNNNPVMIKVKRSDSLIFFEEFVKDWNSDLKEGTQDEKFVRVMNKTMGKFYGKFAMVFIIQGTHYIVRGKTADLYISYLRKDVKSSDSLGWVINTSKEIIDSAWVLYNNLAEIQGLPQILLEIPVILEQETIYKASAFGLNKIGDVEENSYPTKTYPVVKSNFTNAGASGAAYGTTKAVYTDLETVSKKIFNFMEDCSLSPADIQNMLYAAYAVSILEVTEEILNDFYKKVCTKLYNMSTKKQRKAIKKARITCVYFHHYEKDDKYPWMLNDKSVQPKFALKKN